MDYPLRFTLALISSITLGFAIDEIAWGQADAEGKIENQYLDVPVASARGAENLFLEDPMDSHDWSHTEVMRRSLDTVVKGQYAEKSSANLRRLEETLRPIYKALPKHVRGHLDDGAARYALHRYFSKLHGWSIKGLEPAGASWSSTMTVTHDVKDISKYMVPHHFQQLLKISAAEQKVLGLEGFETFDLRALAIFASVLEHMHHAEMLSTAYSIFRTHELPVPGKRTAKEIEDILDTFMLVFALGINLDVSSLQDVQNTKAYLEKSHSGWPQLRAFAQEVKKNALMGSELDFDQIVRVIEKITEGYAQFQGKDCSRAKEVLMAKPSHRNGSVLVSEVQASHATGRRSLFTEKLEDLHKRGVLKSNEDANFASHGDEKSTQLIISNYVNSQSMCLSTASFYSVCCPNECDSVLEKLEREVAGPDADADHMIRLVKALPGPGISEALLAELPTVANAVTGKIRLHSRGFADWMHRAFPLMCPASSEGRLTNPKTPDEWMGDSGVVVQELHEMMHEIAYELALYTTMGKDKSDSISKADDSVPDTSNDVVRIAVPVAQTLTQSQSGGFMGKAIRLTAMLSMFGVVLLAAKSALSASAGPKDKLASSF